MRWANEARHGRGEPSERQSRLPPPLAPSFGPRSRRRCRPEGLGGRGRDYRPRESRPQAGFARKPLADHDFRRKEREILGRILKLLEGPAEIFRSLLKRPEGNAGDGLGRLLGPVELASRSLEVFANSAIFDIVPVTGERLESAAKLGARNGLELVDAVHFAGCDRTAASGVSDRGRAHRIERRRDRRARRRLHEGGRCLEAP